LKKSQIWAPSFKGDYLNVGAIAFCVKAGDRPHDLDLRLLEEVADLRILI